MSQDLVGSAAAAHDRYRASKAAAGQASAQRRAASAAERQADAFVRIADALESIAGSLAVELEPEKPKLIEDESVPPGMLLPADLSTAFGEPEKQQ